MKLPCGTSRSMAHPSVSSLTKRAIDLTSSAILLALLSPIALIIAASIRAAYGGPVVFRQARTGLNERPIFVTKFRTMSGEPKRGDTAKADAARITWLGRLLRRTSLDEIPQLMSVLKGDMSLVGPRPLPTRYLPRFFPVERRRHEVRPGITGWTQVNGRNTLTWDQRLAYDVWYVQHWSLGLDFRILAATFRDVLLMRNTSAPDGPVMEELRPKADV